MHSDVPGSWPLNTSAALCRVITFILLWSGCHLVFAGDERALAELLSSTQYYRAEFSQVVRDSEGVIIDNSNGEMALARPDRLRWDIQAPVAQTVIVDDKTYYQHDSDIDQLIIEQLSDQLSAMPMLLLSGDAEAIAEHYRVTEVKTMVNRLDDADNEVPNQLFKLSPQAPNDLFQLLMFEFSDGVLTAIAILDDLEQNSRFEFSQINNRDVIEDRVFQLDVPPETDVIRR